MEKTLILGLGNPIVSDDGIGIYAVRELIKKQENNELDKDTVDIREACIAGFDLVDLLSGYKKVIILDAIKTETEPPGHIFRLTPEHMRTTVRLAYIHEIDLPMALELGKKVGLPMPKEVEILAVEGENLEEFSEELTPEVQKSLPLLVDMVVRMVNND